MLPTIDNIFVNNLDLVLSGNIITDLRDHFTQFCIMHSTLFKNRFHCSKVRDYSRYDEALFNNDTCKLTGWPCSPNPEMIPTNSFSLFIIG